MNCPRDGREFALQDVFTGGRHATVCTCLTCHGQWMRRSDLERLSEIVTPVLVEWRRLQPAAAQNVELRCPECDEHPVMEKVQSERDARVVMDRCPRCLGVWLDRDELKAIQEESLVALAAGLFRSRPAP